MSKLEGLHAKSLERFGRPVHELTRDELTELYQDAGIMPPPPRPKLTVVRDPDDELPHGHCGPTTADYGDD